MKNVGCMCGMCMMYACLF